MRQTTFDVRVWSVERYVGKRATSYRVTWFVAGRRWKSVFRTAAAADSFRSELVAAQRKGEAFDIESGRPVSTIRGSVSRLTWYDFACRYIDMKWPDASPNHRKSIAEALASITPVLLTIEVSTDEAQAARSALYNWAFNTRRRGTPEQPEDVTALLDSLQRHARPLGDLQQPDVLRLVVERISTRLDGQRAAGRSTTLKRRILSNAFSYAVELGVLDHNPLTTLSWKTPRTAGTVDRRAVANPDQVRALLDAVRNTPRSGPHLVAFFGCLYYAALRPEEAVALRPFDLDLPDGDGWGWITACRAAPEIERQWTDDNTRRSTRQLKHRSRGESRRTPAPPALVALLRHHLATWPCGETDPIFRGERGEALSSLTYRTIWRRARNRALTAAQAASPLAARPYDLRHAAVSTWLSAGVPAPQVAEWAGHSVEVLLRVYAKCIDGGVDAHLTRIQATIGEATTPNGGAPVGRKDTEDHSDPTTTGQDENSP